MNESDTPILIEEKTCRCNKHQVKYVVLQSNGKITEEQVASRIKVFASNCILPLKPGETAVITCPECGREIKIP